MIDNIIVNKGVFTNKHETTKLIINKINYFDTFNNKKFLDVGCGSGVLSLEAAKKEAIVYACDVDVESVENTKLNLKYFNNVKDIWVGRCVDRAYYDYDIIVANLLYSIFKTELLNISVLLKKGGLLIVSGFKTDKTKGIKELARSANLIVTKETNLDNWACFTLQKI